MRCLWQGVKAMFRGLAFFTFFVFVFAVVSFPNLVFACAVVSFIFLRAWCWFRPSRGCGGFV